MLRFHRSAIESAIQNSMAVTTYSLKVAQFSLETESIEGEIVFVESVRLSFFEFWRRLPASVEREKYRFHFMDVYNQLVFRYDNAPHHQSIKTFPHHKHLPSGIIESMPPSFIDVLTEAEAYVLGVPGNGPA